MGGVEKTRFFSNVVTNETATTQTITSVIQGKPGAFITIQVTTLTKSFGGAVYQIDGVTHVLNDTQGYIAGPDGKVTFTQFLNAGTTTPGNVIRVVLTIISTTIGLVGSPNTLQNSKTT